MSVSPVTEGCSEKYWKRLIGKTDLEDALKNLDKLTQEEARMMIAENLRATHAVDERVRGVTEQVLAVDDRVAGVDDRLANVDDRVANVNDKVTEVIHGVQQVERSSSLNLVDIGHRALFIFLEIQLRESVHKWL